MKNTSNLYFHLLPLYAIADKTPIDINLLKFISAEFCYQTKARIIMRKLELDIREAFVICPF